jgi:copper(I)-binding protein
VAAFLAVAAFATMAADALLAAAVNDSTAVAAATVTQQASVGLFFTAHQGDTDDREENRDATQNKTIHCESSKKSYTYRKRNDNLPMPSERPPA